MFRALIFAVIACGFRVRCAREVEDGGQARVQKILEIIEESRFGIHDISRTELDPTYALPRFNMPLELGFFIGATRYGPENQKRLRKIIIFDTEAYRYQRFISDLAGMDVSAHDGNPERAVQQVRNWLSTNSRAANIPDGVNVVRYHRRFVAEALPILAERFDGDLEAVPYADYLSYVSTWLLEDAD